MDFVVCDVTLRLFFSISKFIIAPETCAGHSLAFAN
jgi:hypothetical protein